MSGDLREDLPAQVAAAIAELARRLQLEAIAKIDPDRVKVMRHEIEISGAKPCVLHGGRYDGVVCHHDQSVQIVFPDYKAPRERIWLTESEDDLLYTRESFPTVVYRRRPDIVDGIAHYDLQR